MAQRINSFAGGAVVAPWEVDELPDEWLDAASGLAVELPEMERGQQQVEDYVKKWRAQWQ